jgi:hypothetical protein
MPSTVDLVPRERVFYFYLLPTVVYLLTGLSGIYIYSSSIITVLPVPSLSFIGTLHQIALHAHLSQLSFTHYWLRLTS